MNDRKFSRRNLLRGTAALAGSAAASQLLGGGLFSSKAFGQVASERSALLCVFLHGGYNAVFCSADSFAGAGSFGVTGTNQESLGNGLVIDRPTFGTLPAYAKQHMATIGVRHGLTGHGAARTADWTNGSRSYPLRLAAAMGGDAAIKCAVVGSRMPDGSRPPEGGVSMQTITDMKSTIAALGGANDPTIPDRAITAEALSASEIMSRSALTASPVSLTSVREGFVAGIETLRKPVQQFSYADLAQAYGIGATTTAVTNFRTQMVAAELMITAGANVVLALDGGWDSHGDRSADKVRNMMTQRILPPLNTFLSRMLAVPGLNVVVAIFGDFARSLPGSDHAAVLSATVIGKYVKIGTTGRVDANVRLPAGTPNVEGFWSYLCAALKAPSQPFGENPHPLIL